MPARITQMSIEKPSVGSITTAAPRQVSVSQDDINRLLENRPLLQRMIEEGSLTISGPSKPLASGAPATVIVSLFGYSTPATLTRQPAGTITLKMGDIKIPLSRVDRPLPLPIDKLFAYMKAHDIKPRVAIAPKPRSSFDEAIEKMRDILFGQTTEEEPAVHVPAPSIPYQAPTITIYKRPEVTVSRETPPPSAPNLSWDATLDELNSLIARINDKAIKKQTIAVRNALIALAKQGEDKTNLAGILNLTSRLLTAAPGEERKALASQCRLSALAKQENPSPAWKAFGIAMIIMGTLILGLGVLTCIAAGPIGAAPVIGGALILAAGAGMFARGRSHPEPQTLMNGLCDSIVKDLSSATSI